MAKRQKRVGVRPSLDSLREVESGTEVIIMRGGRSVARITRASDETSAAASYGMFTGQFVVADDFDAGAGELGDLFGIAKS